MLQEQSRLEDIDSKRRRIEILDRKNATTPEEVDNITNAWLGQKDRVKKLLTAVEELKQRAERSGSELDDGSPQLQPLLAEIDSLPELSVAAEAVPHAALGIGVRVGATTSGDISGGFLYRLPVEFTEELRLDYAVRYDGDSGDLTHHVGLSAGF